MCVITSYALSCFSSIADLRDAHPSLGWFGLDLDHQPGRNLLLHIEDIS